MLGALADSIRDFVGLAQTNSDITLLVSDNRQCGKAETTSTFDDFGTSIDEDDLLDHLRTITLGGGVPTITTGTSAITAGTAVIAWASATALAAIGWLRAIITGRGSRFGCLGTIFRRGFGNRRGNRFGAHWQLG